MTQPTRSATDAGRTEAELGLALVTTVAGRDRDGLQDLFADGVAFRALTPGRLWEADSPEGAAELVLGTWFGPDTEVVRVTSVATSEVAGRSRVDYVLELMRPGGAATVAQTAYLAAARGRITGLQLLCSGIRPSPG